MPFAAAQDGIKLYYDTFGSGDPLLLIMGQGRDHHGWDLIRDDFTQRYQVIVYDHRGTGQSDKPRQPPYSTRGFAQDAIAVLDHLGVRRAHVYGVSMGGRICQWLGIDHPCRVKTVVLGCTTPGNAYGVRRSSEIDKIIATGDWSLKAGTLVSPEWIASHPTIYKKWERIARRQIPAYAQRLHFLASEKHNTWDQLAKIVAPTLIIHGSEDQVNLTANAYLLAERIPNAELHVVNGGRHEFFVEFREEASTAVLEFLARHPLDG